MLGLEEAWVRHRGKWVGSVELSCASIRHAKSMVSALVAQGRGKTKWCLPYMVGLQLPSSQSIGHAGWDWWEFESSIFQRTLCWLPLRLSSCQGWNKFRVWILDKPLFGKAGSSSGDCLIYIHMISSSIPIIPRSGWARLLSETPQSCS